MPYEIRVPRLGWSMEEGTFLGWRKQPGEQVAVGDALFELESDKAQQEIASVDAGILHIPEGSPQPGTVVQVGSLLGYLLLQEEPLPVAPSYGDLPERGRASSGDTAGKEHLPAKEKIGRLTRAVASPRARRVAAELGVVWTQLQGTGQSGRIREADVRAALVADPAKPLEQSISEQAACTRLPLSTRRKAIAERLRSSYERTIPVTLTTTTDATRLVELRKRFRVAQMPVVPTYTDLIACLVATVLLHHRALAARWESDHQALVQLAGDNIDIGIAVDTPQGLLVPVVRAVGRKSAAEIAGESQALIEQARSGLLTAAQMQGGFFTITNLGAFGIDAFTPVINYPEVAILGLGTIRREPVVSPDGGIVTRDRMMLSLTFDHAAIDGAPAAAFLRDIGKAIENPAARLSTEAHS